MEERGKIGNRKRKEDGRRGKDRKQEKERGQKKG